MIIRGGHFYGDLGAIMRAFVMKRMDWVIRVDA